MQVCHLYIYLDWEINVDVGKLSYCRETVAWLTASSSQSNISEYISSVVTACTILSRSTCTRNPKFSSGSCSVHCLWEANVVGFDPTIYYENGKRRVRSVDLDGNEVIYTMVHARPVFYRETIRGRGTTCWTVQNDDGDTFLVKDGWKAPGRVHESAFLKLVKDLDGVGRCEGFRIG